MKLWFSTIISNATTYSRNVSFLLKISEADYGTSKAHKLKYFTSLNNLTKAGSKFTLNRPFSSLANNGYFCFSSETLPTSYSQLNVFLASYSDICLSID